MRKLILIFLFMFLGGLLFNAQVFPAEKLGYVNLSRIFNAYTKTKEYDKILEQRQKDYEHEREKKADGIKKLQDKLGLLNEKQKKKREAEIEKKIRSFQEYDTKKRQDLRKERDERIREILEDIEKAVRQYAESQSYTLVFNDRVLVYQLKDQDLTDKVIEIVNNSYQKKR